MTYPIADFWRPRFQAVDRPSSPLSLPGWTIENAPNPSFIQADLVMRPEYDDLTAPVWLVAAPGAVGKSTFAKEISAQTGAAYLDLAKAETVAGNYLTGGLVKNGLLSAWQAGKMTILIDALDEARLRVTQNSFEDFLRDVNQLSRNRSLPTVFFGRVGIIDEAWIILAEFGLSCPIFDIDFFDFTQANMFIMAALQRLQAQDQYKHLAASLQSHQAVYRTAVENVVVELQNATATDGKRFAGYAPVLEVIAAVLAGVRNPSRLNDVVQETLHKDALHKISAHILDREAEKVRAQLPAVIPSTVKETLYGRDEQMDRLIAVVYQQARPALPAVLSPQQQAAYDEAIKNFLPNHPFLDGSGKQPSGAVFSAVLNASALFSADPNTQVVAQIHAGDGPHTPNPFLIDFYLHNARAKHGDELFVPPEHLVALYESVRARAQAGDIVRFSLDGDETDEDAEAEIQITSTPQNISHQIRLPTSQAGTLRFGRHVSGVAVDAPLLDVIIGSGNSVEMVAPVSFNVARLSFDCPELVVSKVESSTEDSSVFVEARQLIRSAVSNAPIVRQGVELSVSWPNAKVYPWSSFVSGAGTRNGEDVHNALLRFRTLVMAFRSHSKGRLARFKDKIEHARMTKGVIGVAIREKMMRDQIITLDGEMYFLDPTRLGQITGAKYQDIKMKRFADKVRQYVADLD